MRWPKYWSFSLSISPSNEYPGLISFRMDWLDLLAVQGTLKSLLQHHSSKTSILQCSAFFTVQLSHPYMSTGKIIALTRQTLVGKPEVFWNLKLSCMSFLLSLSFAVPVFQHAGPLATSPVLSFLHLHLPPWEFSPSWAPAVFGLLLAGATPRLLQPG